MTFTTNASQAFDGATVEFPPVNGEGLRWPTVVVDVMCDLYSLAGPRSSSSWKALAVQLLNLYLPHLSTECHPHDPAILCLCADLYDVEQIQRDLVASFRAGGRRLRRILSNGTELGAVSLNPSDYPAPPANLLEYLEVPRWKAEVLLPCLGAALRTVVAEQAEPSRVILLRGFTSPLPERIQGVARALGRTSVYTPMQGGWQQTSFFDDRIPIGTAEGDIISVALAGFLSGHRVEFLDHLGYDEAEPHAGMVITISVDGDLYYVCLCHHLVHSQIGLEGIDFWLGRISKQGSRGRRALRCYHLPSLASYIEQEAGGILNLVLLMLTTGSDYTFSLRHVTPAVLQPALKARWPTQAGLWQELSERLPSVYRHLLDSLKTGAEPTVGLETTGIPRAEPLAFVAWVLRATSKIMVISCSCPSDYQGPCLAQVLPKTGVNWNLTFHHLLSFAESLRAALIYFCTETSLPQLEQAGTYWSRAYTYTTCAAGRECIFGAPTPSHGDHGLDF